MAKRYIPDPDAEFDEWLQNFSNQVQQIGPQVGLLQSEIDALVKAAADWVAGYQAHIVARNAAHAAKQTKDGLHDNAETISRRVTRQLQANPQLTDAQRSMLGITVPDLKPTPQSPEYVLGLTPPLIALDFSIRGQIAIHHGTNPENERENAKPDGIAGVKIWFHVVSPRPQVAKESTASKFLMSLDYQDWHEWNFLADDTNSPYIHVIETTVPITIDYKAQWFDNSMRLGAFGDPVRATVTP